MDNDKAKWSFKSVETYLLGTFAMTCLAAALGQLPSVELPAEMRVPVLIVGLVAALGLGAIRAVLKAFGERPKREE